MTTAFPYSYEARPYALVVGFGALALLSWQSIALDRRRAVWIPCLALSLAATVSSHYYGLLVLFPFAAGESARTLRRRRIDVAIWASMVVAVVPLAFHLPLLSAGAAYSGAFWSPPQWVNLPDFYQDLLTPALVPLIAILVVTSLLVQSRGTAAASRRYCPPSRPGPIWLPPRASCSFPCSRWSLQRSPPAHSSIGMRLQRSSGLVPWLGWAQRWHSGTGRRFS